MKKKIAILTQPLELNYGGIIQNYALQKVLMNMGHQTVTLNRIRESPHPPIKVFANKYKTLILRHVFQVNKPSYLDYKKISKNNIRFLREHINLSKLLSSSDSLANYFKKEKFDAVVVGSDQVWRPIREPNIANFYLDFLEDNSSINKLTYAASFGTENWEYSEKQTKKCSELIQQFNGVSVREDSGVRLCSDFLNRKDSIHVLDPTLLLDADDYSQLIGQPKKEMGLFSYVLDDSDEKFSFINNCAKILNLTSHRNQAKDKRSNLKIEKLDDYVIPPLEGWLQGFRDANFVITDSFHGTVFSILNQKPFFVLVNNERGASRFESILKQLDLENRLIYDVKNFDLSKLKLDIDYEAVNFKLNELKIQSFNFLNTHL